MLGEEDGPLESLEESRKAIPTHIASDITGRIEKQMRGQGYALRDSFF